MGQQLSAPITTTYVERLNTNIFHSAAVSMQGWRISMEDSHNMCEKLNNTGMMLFGVYDGHGGPLAAEFLSRVIPHSFSSLSSITNFEEISECMLQVDEDFLSSGNQDGSTLCFVLAQPWDTSKDEAILQSVDELDHTNTNLALKIVSVNIGDSRAMIVRKSGDFVAITEDHKPYDEKERARILNAGGFVSNHRVDGNLALSRAIGDREYKMNNELPPDQQKVIAVPDFQEHFLYRGDSLLVCCDGIFESVAMTHQSVATIIKNSIQDYATPGKDSDIWDPAAVIRDVLEASLLSDSKDNHTAILVHFTSEEPLDLPKKECIPGFFDTGDEAQDSFARVYKEDLERNGYNYEDLKPVITAIGEELANSQALIESEKPKWDLEKLGTSYQPIVRVPRASRGPHQSPPLANFLFNFFMNSGLERDDLEDMNMAP